MFRLLNFDIITVVFRAICVLLAISIHEMSHGYAAYFCGDKTAKAMGRLSLNPLRHLDPVGAICLLLFGFGWAKPVMVNPYYLKKPKRDMMLISLAGPLSNFFLAFIGLLFYKLFSMTNLFYQPTLLPYLLVNFLNIFVFLNIGLGVFNLIPIPPLDGSKIFLPLLPYRLYEDIMRHERLGWLILVFALTLGVLDPVMNTVGNFIFFILSFLVGGI